MATYIGNSFSLNMLENLTCKLDCTEISLEQVQGILERRRDFAATAVISCVGHTDTARVISANLGHEIVVSRDTVTLSEGDAIIVAQYTGERLPEGATKLPEGATLKYIYVRVVPPLEWDQGDID